MPCEPLKRINKINVDNSFSKVLYDPFSTSPITMDHEEQSLLSTILRGELTPRNDELVRTLCIDNQSDCVRTIRKAFSAPDIRAKVCGEWARSTAVSRPLFEKACHPPPGRHGFQTRYHLDGASATGSPVQGEWVQPALHSSKVDEPILHYEPRSLLDDPSTLFYAAIVCVAILGVSVSAVWWLRRHVPTQPIRQPTVPASVLPPRQPTTMVQP